MKLSIYASSYWVLPNVALTVPFGYFISICWNVSQEYALLLLYGLEINMQLAKLRFGPILCEALIFGH